MGRRNLEAEAHRACFEPRCHWECGVSPAPEPDDVPGQPPATPAHSEPGDKTIEEGATIYVHRRLSHETQGPPPQKGGLCCGWATAPG